MKKMLLLTALVTVMFTGYSFADSCSITVQCDNGEIGCSVSINPGTTSCTATADSVTCTAFAPDGSVVSSRTRECGSGPDFSSICDRFPFLSICN